jgi:hypothetical protein
MFREKYQYFPGDLPTAESFWGSDVSCPNSPITSDPKTVTCNGNGDGIVGSSYPDVSGYYELFRFWQQLANAGFVTGGYTGVMTGSNPTPEGATPGINVPAGALPNSGYTLYYCLPGTSCNHPAYFTGQYGQFFHVGAYYAPNVVTGWPVFTPAEAWSIDQKIDDGLPASGLVMTYNLVQQPNCVTSSDPTTAVYNTSYTAMACGLMYMFGFN